MFIFVIATFAFKYWMQHKIKQVEEKIIRTEDFSLECYDFDKSIKSNQQLKDHFSQFGEVTEVFIARDYKGKLLQFKEYSDLMK